MIQSQDRSYYIGCSDTSVVVGNWKTKTFEKWWLEKLGVNKNSFSNEATKAGNNYEHKILDSLEIEELEKDKQIIIDRLRANLDGNTDTCIYEVKTHNAEKEFKVSKQYWRQAQVEMYASGIHKLYIVAYGLIESDYNNYFNAGIIVMNLKALREYKFQEKFLYMLGKIKFEVAQDQDYMNRLCKGRVKLLGFEWNRMPAMGKCEGIINLVHYNLGCKPWYFDDVLYQEYFWKYAKKTEFYDEIRAMKSKYTDADKEKDDANSSKLIELAKLEADCVGDDRRK